MEEQKIMYKVDKDGLVEKFVYQLPILRAVLDMSQDDVGEIVGLSRQTYSSIETGKRKMTWSNFMALLFFFYFNPSTKETIENAGVFPDELKDAMKVDRRKNRTEEDKI